jgi:hypothetical protein
MALKTMLLELACCDGKGRANALLGGPTRYFYSLLMARCHKSYLIDQPCVALPRPNRSKVLQNQLTKSLLMNQETNASVLMTPGATLVSMMRCELPRRGYSRQVSNVVALPCSWLRAHHQAEAQVLAGTQEIVRLGG